ncbi:helix-turn-helix transcriptional regulator [Cryptosporangium minutisporangium]|uniref:Helix-turn-helix transcriptional regulator n=1 Tax=Cryptosporangium minutisporangium TaxID=113569 RepID=A0ABP6T305_9ACTN
MNSRDEVAAFLRARRARLKPAGVGLPDGIRRRTPGLRRQEVAQLAGMSIDYYIRLEQGRGPNPSRQVLSALARALMLNRDERDYLFRVAGENPPTVIRPARELTPAIRYLLASLSEVPAYVVDAKYDVLAWNDLAIHFISDLSLVPEADRNMVRWMFRRPDDDPHWDEESAEAFARSTIADLRAAYARYPGDPGIEGLVTELLGTSARFAEMWAAHDVEERRRIVKSVVSPLFGQLEFECQVLQIPETGQRLIFYCAEPGSPTHQVFRRLADVKAATASTSPGAPEESRGAFGVR